MANPKLDSAARILVDLAEYQIPQLRECRNSLTLHQQFSNEIKTELSKLRGLVEVCCILSLKSGELLIRFSGCSRGCRRFAKAKG